LTSQKTKEILKEYGRSDLGTVGRLPVSLKEYFKNKNYCILIFFDRVEGVKPFEIDKTGFGAMSAWLCVDNVRSILK